MKISFYIPKNTQGINQFLQKELATASNIKDRQTRVSVETGLSKIISCL